MYQSPSFRIRLRLFLFAAALMLGLGCSPWASATPITYLLTGNFTGTLGNIALSGPVTFQLNADTDAVQDMGGYTVNTAGTSTITANGRTATFTSKTFGVEAEYFSAAFLDTASFDFAANVYNFDVSSDVLSQTGVSYTGDYNSLLNGPAQTSLGALQITGATGDVTFSTLAASTPEPSSLLLLGTATLSGMGLLRRRLALAS